MRPLNFPRYPFRFKNRQNKIAVFDDLRKKFVHLTPEEWVRQHVVQFLLSEKGFPKSLLNVEKKLILHDLTRRYDIVAFTPQGKVHLLVECKAPHVQITQDTFDQIARYNLAFQARFLMVTNGIDHFFCQMDYQKKEYIFLRDLPAWD